MFAVTVAVLAATVLAGPARAAAPGDGRKCHGLALASGKSHGPYQAGAIYAMLEQFVKDANETGTFNGTWDAVSGVTEGALNAYILSLRENEQSVEDVSATMKDLSTFWAKMGAEEVYAGHSFGMLEGLVLRDGVFRADPLMKLIDEVFGGDAVHLKNSKRALNIGIANLLNGTFVSFNDNFKTRDLIKALKASVAYPGVFAPFDAWNSTWLAGSAVWNIDVAAPILRCKHMGFAEEDIIIDAIIDDADELDTVDVSNYNAFEMGLRTYEVMSYYTARKALLNAQIAYPAVSFRHVVGPKTSWRQLSLDQLYRSLFQLVPISYSEREVSLQMKQGYKDAEAAMKVNAGGHKKYHIDVKDTFYRSGDL